MTQKDDIAKKSIWKCPVCRNEEKSDKRPKRCHICGTPGERLMTKSQYADKNQSEK